jgi:hypothetical protein
MMAVMRMHTYSINHHNDDDVTKKENNNPKITSQNDDKRRAYPYGIAQGSRQSSV